MAGVECLAATHYIVPVNSNAQDPYTNWATAGTNIIDVVNAAQTNIAARVVWVTNGTYYPTNQIYITNELTFQSVNGRDVTILDGANASTSRCAYFTSTSTVFNGFTVTNYHTVGNDGALVGSIFLNCRFVSNATTHIGMNTGGRGTILMSAGGIVTNCIFKNNKTDSLGGGIYANSTVGVKILDCRFEGNEAVNGGACAFRQNTTISNCVIVNNIAGNNSSGGGLYITGTTNIYVLNCAITGNVISGGTGKGGGVSVLSGSGTIKDCSIIGNSLEKEGGGIYSAGDSVTNMIIRNCLIARNRSTVTSGGGIWMTNGIIESCTIVSNYAAVAGGGVYIDGSGSGTNNIIYFNTAASAANFTNTAGNTGLNYCCVIPAVGGTGNTTNNPMLKNLAGGDYRLRMTSPCVNAGTNQPWMTNTVDLEGNTRILKTIVDMGTYETRIWQGTIYSVP